MTARISTMVNLLPGTSSTAMVDTESSPPEQQDSIMISSGHNDYILATALDAYGGRLATCSGDRCVKVWVLHQNEWTLAHTWQAHTSAVTDVAWAHPEFGTLLATASADHSWKVWQDEGSSIKSTSYTMKATLTEARRAATCVAFAPRHWGLKVASGSADGCLRIYEAVDVANVAQWPLAATLTMTQQQNHDNGGHQQQHQQHTATHTTANHHSISAVSWCTGRFDAPTLATASTVGCTVVRYSEQARNWQAILQIPSAVIDVAWAPNVGRRHHTLAMTTAAGGLRIVTLERATTQLASTQDMDDGGSSAVWKCQWNVTGTVLATTGDAGLLQLYKKDPSTGDYKVVSQVRGDLEKIAGT